MSVLSDRCCRRWAGGVLLRLDAVALCCCVLCCDARREELSMCRSYDTRCIARAPQDGAVHRARDDVTVGSVCVLLYMRARNDDDDDADARRAVAITRRVDDK